MRLKKKMDLLILDINKNKEIIAKLCSRQEKLEMELIKANIDKIDKVEKRVTFLECDHAKLDFSYNFLFNTYNAKCLKCGKYIHTTISRAEHLRVKFKYLKKEVDEKHRNDKAKLKEIEKELSELTKTKS